MPKVPILSRMPTSSTEVPGVACSAVVGSQVCTGNIGALTMKATRNPTISQRPRSVPIGSLANSVSR